MQFLTAVLFASAAVALPASTGATSETVSVTNFNVRKNPKENQVDFDLYTGDSAKLVCSAAIPGTNGASQPCGTSEYRFTLNAGSTASSYELAIHRILDPVETSRSGQTTVNVYCHAGGNGPEDFVCNQVGGAATATVKVYGS